MLQTRDHTTTPRSRRHDDPATTTTTAITTGAGGWKGAVSRRPRITPAHALHHTKPKTDAGPTKEYAFTQSTLPQSSATSTTHRHHHHHHTLTDSGKLFGTTAELKQIDETVATVIPDYKPTSERLLSPPPPLPIGKTATKVLKKVLETSTKPVAQSGPPDKRKTARGSNSQADIQRAARMAADRNFRAWKAKKAQELAEEKAKRAAERRRHNNLETKREERRANAHKEWLERKKRDAQKSTRNKKRSVFSGGLTIEEFIAGVRRAGFKAALVPLFEELLALLDDTGGGRVNRPTFFDLLAQVSLQDRINERAHDIQAERDANPLPEKKQEWTPEQRTAVQREALVQRIGEKILNHAGGSLGAMVHLLSTADAAFRVADEDLIGTLKDDTIKACLKDLPLGISTTDQIEVAKIMRGGDQGERMPYSRFADFLVDVEARRQLEPDVEIGQPRAFELAAELCRYSTAADTHSLFDACCKDCLEYRRAVNRGSAGWIPAKQFKSAIQNVEDNLSLAKRKDLHKAIDLFCKSVDHQGDGIIEIAQVDLFLRKMELEAERKAAREAMDAELRRREDAKFRYWRTAIKNVAAQGLPFDVLESAVSHAVTSDVRHAHSMRADLSADNARNEEVYMMPGEFTIALKDAGIGLSPVQIDELARLYRLETDGRGVHRSSVLADFAAAKIRVDEIAARKADNRIQLATDVIRSLGSSIDRLPDVLYDYQVILMTWDAPKDRETTAPADVSGNGGGDGTTNGPADTAAQSSSERLSARQPSQQPEEANGTEAPLWRTASPTFDITWGYDDVTHRKIQMPPGELPRNDKFKLKQHH
eukprot:m.75213 g.75213  ORF g.75213 m.75213 type:complete len:823 (-) comp8974_c0_seq1:145-2613(-)